MIAFDVAQAAANIFTLIDDDMKRLCSVLVVYFSHIKREWSFSNMLYCYMLEYFSTWPNAICSSFVEGQQSATTVIAEILCVCLCVCSTLAEQRACEEGCVEPEATTGGDCSDDTLLAGNGDTQQYVHI